MQKLAEICIKRPIFASMLVLALVVVGAASYLQLGVDRFPSVDLPTVAVRTSLPGGAPEDVEAEISDQIEEVVNTVEGIRELRSISVSGMSIVVATFNLDRDIDAATEDIRGRVQAEAPGGHASARDLEDGQRHGAGADGGAVCQPLGAGADRAR